jgi:hypothetical protein
VCVGVRLCVGVGVCVGARTCEREKLSCIPDEDNL